MELRIPGLRSQRVPAADEPFALDVALAAAAARSAAHARAGGNALALPGAVRGLTRALTLPAVAWVVFNVNLLVWHLPGPYDATPSNSSLHVLEHTTFLVFGILFWAQALGCPPARKRLPLAQRIAYLAAAAVPNIALSMFHAFAQHPLYSHYAELAHRPGAITALVDQQPVRESCGRRVISRLPSRSPGSCTAG